MDGRGADHMLDDDIESDMDFRPPLTLGSLAEETAVAGDDENYTGRV